MDLIREITQEYLKNDIPDFRPGDNVKVHVRLREGEKERIQIFEGLVIARKHGGVSETFTVRKMSSGVGVERVFPLHAPSVTNRFETSCAWLNPFRTEVFGSRPIRAVPIS